MDSDTNHEELLPQTVSEEERLLVEDLILQNKTLDALIKGLTADLETFKQNNGGRWTPADTVRFTMQLNIMRDKKSRNLTSINDIIKRNSIT